MSTRTNIIVQYGDSRVYLYRHHDGYLAETGADLAQKLVAADKDPNLFLRSLIEEVYEKQSYETEPRRVYELTSEVHGDIEYLYGVRFNRRSGAPEIGYRHYGLSSDADRPGGAAGMSSIRFGEIATFVESVNGAIREQNRRLATLRKEQPAVFGAYTDAPEIVLSNLEASSV